MGPNYYVESRPQSNGFNFLAGKGKFLIIGLVIAVVIAIGLMLGSGSQNNTQNKAALSEKLASIVSLLTSTTITRNIKDGDLNQLVTDYSLTLQTDLNDVSEAPANIVPLTNESEIGKKLNDAYLNNKLDQAFASELTTQAKSAKVTTAALYSKTSDKKTQQQLKSVNTHLTEIETKIGKMNL